MDHRNLDKSLSFVNAHIASNNGWDEITFSLRGILLNNQSKVILSSIVITGDYWDVEKRLASSPRLDLSRHFNVELTQILLSEESLVALMNNLDAWLIKPFSFELNISGNSEN